MQLTCTGRERIKEGQNWMLKSLYHRRRTAHDDLGVGADGRQVLLDHGLIDEP